MRRIRSSVRRRGRDGQSLVEFSVGLIVFMMIFIGIIELGRGVFLFNGVSQVQRRSPPSSAAFSIAAITRSVIEPAVSRRTRAASVITSRLAMLFPWTE